MYSYCTVLVLTVLVSPQPPHFTITVLEVRFKSTPTVSFVSELIGNQARTLQC